MDFYAYKKDDLIDFFLLCLVYFDKISIKTKSKSFCVVLIFLQTYFFIQKKALLKVLLLKRKCTPFSFFQSSYPLTSKTPKTLFMYYYYQICVYVSLFVCVCAYVCVCVYIYVCVCLHAWVCVCFYACGVQCMDYRLSCIVYVFECVYEKPLIFRSLISVTLKSGVFVARQRYTSVKT